MPTRKGAVKDLVELQTKINNIISEVMEPGVRAEDDPVVIWSPPTDVSEDEDAYYVEMEVPGADIKDIEVFCEETMLRVTGERKMTRDLAPDNVQRMERFFGTFSREFSFLSPVSTDSVEAMLNDGVLTLILPKKSERKKIPIKQS